MLSFECIGKCGKVINNSNVDLAGQDVAGAICPECAAAHDNAPFKFDEAYAGWALLSSAVVAALKV